MILVLKLVLLFIVMCAASPRRDALPRPGANQTTSWCNEALPSLERNAGNCPPGLFCKEGHCKCGVYPDNIIRCNGTDLFVLRYFCVTFDTN